MCCSVLQCVLQSVLQCVPVQSPNPRSPITQRVALSVVDCGGDAVVVVVAVVAGVAVVAAAAVVVVVVVVIAVAIAVAVAVCCCYCSWFLGRMVGCLLA